jgi:S1-C subfamily serine protease
MICVHLLLLFPAQVEIVPSAEFPRKLQMTAITATVRIVNVARKSEGSGVVLGRKGEFVYILTARHIVENAGRLDVSTFSAQTHPMPNRVYEATVMATTNSLRDLALIRLATQDEMPGSLPLFPAQFETERNPFQALSVGCSRGAAPTGLIDKVLGNRKVQRKMEEGTAFFWEVDRKQVPGRSGGPLVDRRGYLIGICSGTNQEKSYFCDIKEIRAFLKPHGLE